MADRRAVVKVRLAAIGAFVFLGACGGPSQGTWDTRDTTPPAHDAGHDAPEASSPAVYVETPDASLEAKSPITPDAGTDAGSCAPGTASEQYAGTCKAYPQFVYEGRTTFWRCNGTVTPWAYGVKCSSLDATTWCCTQ